MTSPNDSEPPLLEMGGPCFNCGRPCLNVPLAPASKPPLAERVDIDALELTIKQALPMTMRNESPCEARVALAALMAVARAKAAG